MKTEQPKNTRDNGFTQLQPVQNVSEVSVRYREQMTYNTCAGKSILFVFPLPLNRFRSEMKV